MKNSGREGTGTGIFDLVPEAKVVLALKGQYSYGAVATRGGKLYAVYKDVYVRLLANGDTSLKGLAWDEIIGADARETAFGLELDYDRNLV